MADALRRSMDAAEYKHVVLGLIFLKYISGAFEEQARRALSPTRRAALTPKIPTNTCRCSRYGSMAICCAAPVANFTIRRVFPEPLSSAYMTHLFEAGADGAVISCIVSAPSAISNREPGLTVPMPTLPPELILILS